MKKSTALKIVNVALFINIVLLGFSGLFHASIPYETYSAVHPVFGYILCGLAVLHLILNWTWIKGVLFKKG